MRLVTKPGADVISYVERIQRRLSRHRVSLRSRNDAFFESVRTLAREYSPMIEATHGAALPDHLAGSFGIVKGGELARRVDEAAGMSTEFQNAAALLDLLELWYDVVHFIDRVSDHYGHGQSSVFLATVPHWSHNARAFTHTPSGVHIVAFYDRIFDFVGDLSLALPLSVMPPDAEMEDIASFPVLATKLFDEQGDASPAAVQMCLQHFIGRHHDNDFPRTLEIGTLSESIRLLGQDIELSMRAFVMGHEIAHIFCSHEGENKFWSAGEGDGEEDAGGIQETTRHWDQEYEADYVGFKLGRGVTIPWQIPLTTYVWSVLLFFIGNEWLMRLRNRHGDASSDQGFRMFDPHPPFSRRRDWILKIAETEQSELPLDLRPLRKLAGLIEATANRERGSS